MPDTLQLARDKQQLIQKCLNNEISQREALQSVVLNQSKFRIALGLAVFLFSPFISFTVDPLIQPTPL